MTTIPEPHPAASGPGTQAPAEEPQIPASARRAPDLAQRTQGGATAPEQGQGQPRDRKSVV